VELCQGRCEEFEPVARLVLLQDFTVLYGPVLVRCRATRERLRSYTTDASDSIHSGDSLSKTSADPETAFVVSTEPTSEAERRASVDRRLPVRSARAYGDSATATGVVPPGAVRRRSQPTATELQDYGVPYESPRSDERTPDRPRSGADPLPARSDTSPLDAALDKDTPDFDDIMADEVSTAVRSTTSAVADNGADQLGRRRGSLSSLDAVFERTASLCRSSDNKQTRRTSPPDADDRDGVEAVFVRRRAASFGVGGTSTRNRDDVRQSPSRRRRMSLFGQPHPADDSRVAAAAAGVHTDETTKSGIRGARGRVDKPGLPPKPRPASGDSDGRRRRSPGVADDAAAAAAVWASPSTTMRTSDRSAAAASNASKPRRRTDEPVSGNNVEPETAEKTAGEDGGRHRHGSRHRRSHGNNDADEEERTGAAGNEGRRHWLRKRRPRSASEHRTTPSDDEQRWATSRPHSAFDGISRRLRRHRAGSLDRAGRSAPLVDEV